MKIINYFLQSIFVYIFFLIAFFLRLKLSRIIFSSLFCVIGPFFKSRKIVNNNLEIFSKENTQINKNEIISNMWKNYGMTFVEYIFLNSFRKESSHVTIKGREIIQNVYQGNRPVIFVSGHFANFELMSMEITKNKIPLATIYRPLNNIFLNPFMEYLRKKYVCKNQIKKGINGVRETIDYINKNYSIALMIDQRVSEGEAIPFFGRQALTTTLPAQLALKYNIDIIPVYIERDKNNNFTIEYLKKISPKTFESKSALSAELNKVLEKMIIRNSGQWIWTHNRWK